MNNMEEKEQVQYQESIVLNPGMVEQAEDWEDFVSMWMLTKEVDKVNQWVKGDVIDKVAGKFSEGSLAKFASEIGESLTTLVEYRRVSRAFEPGRREGNLTWTHYKVASYADSYDPVKQRFESDNRYELIEQAENGGWTVARLNHEVKNSKTLQKPSAFDTYAEFITRVKNYLTHADKNNLSNSERAKLITMLKEAVDDIYKYLISN